MNMYNWMNIINTLWMQSLFFHLFLLDILLLFSFLASVNALLGDRICNHIKEIYQQYFLVDAYKIRYHIFLFIVPNKLYWTYFNTFRIIFLMGWFNHVIIEISLEKEQLVFKNICGWLLAILIHKFSFL